MTCQNIYIKMESKNFRFHTDVLWAIFTLLNIFIFVGGFAQTGGNLYERNKNYTEEYIVQQQSQIFTPTHTPNGSLESPAVGNARQIVYTPINQGSEHTSQTIINQQNRRAAQMMGVKLPPTQADIDRERKSHMNGKPPELSEEQKQRQEVSNLLNDVHNREPSTNEYWKTPEFTLKQKPYYDALNKLKEQLEGKRKLSVADAYFEIENSEGNTLATQKEFKDDINKCASFIKRWMMENKLDFNNNLAVHFAIQKFMSDSLKIGKHVIEIPDIEPTTHLPFYYDYDDYKAEKDDRSYHVSKGFATGNGQCHVLPLMYGCIAEALGVKFYLSYAPFHSFISYPDNTNKIHNYETTTNWEISDQWYKDNLNVSSLAEKNQIYLNKMDRKQIVAAAMLDLAFSYKKKNGVADGKFITECVDFAMNYFPNKESNIDGWLMRGEVNAVELDRVLMKKGVKDVSKVEQIPEAKLYLDKLNTINKKIESLGYSEEDAEIYDRMVQESKAKHLELQQKDNLKKRNLFVPLTIK